MQRSVRILGIVCITIAVLCVLVSVPIVGLTPPIRIGVPAAIGGFLLGCTMAAITRVRIPTFIYILIVVGALTLWPLRHPWPLIEASDFVRLESLDRSEMRYNYLEMLRAILYILAIPFPYAAFGQHAADKLTGSVEAKLEVADDADEETESKAKS